MSDRSDEHADTDSAAEVEVAEDGADEGSAPKESRGRRRRTIREERMGGKRKGEEFRVPAWVVIPLATGAGFFVSSWPGAVFGFLAGLALWWSRR